jgi:archaellum biogenesis ATPase FlaH
LIHKDRKKGIEIALIPELCFVLSTEDAMRANNVLISDLTEIVQTDAEIKVNEFMGLLEMLNSNPKCIKS